MTLIHKTARCVLSSLVALTLVATVEARQWMVPAAAHAVGANDTNWRTDLRIATTSTTPVTVTVTLLPTNNDNSSLERTVSVTVPAGGHIELADALDSSFGYGGTAALLVEADAELTVTSRTYNLTVCESETCTFGQFIPGVEVSQAIFPGETGHLVYLLGTDAFRSNVGFANTSGETGKAFVTLIDGSGTELGTAEANLLPWAHFQINDVFAAAGAPNAGTEIRAEIRTEVPVVAYASVIDSQTGDPVAIMARHLIEAARELIVPVIAHAQGAAGSQWRSDLRLANVGIASATVTIAYVPRGDSAASDTKTVTLAAGELLALDDVAAELFGVDSGVGTLWIESTQALLMASRTYNQAPQGTFGQSIDPIAPRTSMAGGDTATFTGLAGGSFRSNLGLLNLGDSALSIQMRVFDGSGNVVGQDQRLLAARQLQQIDDVLGALGVSAARGGGLYALEVLALGTGRFTAYASVVDNTSNDPVYVAAKTRRGASSGACRTIPLAIDGTVVTWNLEADQDGSTVSGTITTTFDTVTDSYSKTSSSQQVEAGGFSIVTDTVTEQTYLVVDDPAGYVASDRIETEVTATVFGTTTTTSTVVDHDPARVVGPGYRWCEGETWTIPSVEQTVEVTGFDTIVQDTGTGNGVTLSTSEMVTVPAGTFTTVVSERNFFGDPDDPTTRAWVDVDSGQLVRQESTDANGTVVTLLELVSVE